MSENVVCLSRLLHILLKLLINGSVETNSVDPDQSDLVIHCLTKNTSQNIAANDKSRRLLLLFALLGLTIIQRTCYIK